MAIPGLFLTGTPAQEIFTGTFMSTPHALTYYDSALNLSKAISDKEDEAVALQGYRECLSYAR